MTAATKTSTWTNGWNAVVDALNNKKDIENFSAKIKDVQKINSPSNPIYHYAQGAKEAIEKFNLTNEIPEKE